MTLEYEDIVGDGNVVRRSRPHQAATNHLKRLAEITDRVSDRISSISDQSYSGRSHDWMSRDELEWLRSGAWENRLEACYPGKFIEVAKEPAMKVWEAVILIEEKVVWTSDKPFVAASRDLALVKVGAMYGDVEALDAAEGVDVQIRPFYGGVQS